MEEEMNVTQGGGAGAQNEGNTQNNATDTNVGQAQSEKTYTEADFQSKLQSETDKRVTQALKTAQEKWQADYEKKLQSEKDEASRLAKMSADERAKEEFKKERETFESEREKYQRERLEFECAKQLGENELPVSFSAWLTGNDAETTKSNFEKFKDEFSKAVQAAVENRVKGTPPKTGNQDAGTDAFLQGFGG